MVLVLVSTAHLIYLMELHLLPSRGYRIQFLNKAYWQAHLVITRVVLIGGTSFDFSILFYLSIYLLQFFCNSHNGSFYLKFQWPCFYLLETCTSNPNFKRILISCIASLFINRIRKKICCKVFWSNFKKCSNNSVIVSKKLKSDHSIKK